MPQVLLYRYGPLLLVLHALSGLCLGGASIHLTVVAVQALRGRLRPRLHRLYALVALCAYIGAMVTGGLLYPRYRYHIRGLYLDRHAVWASNLFDMKENLATLGLPLIVGAFLLSRDVPAEVRSGERAALRLYVMAAAGAAAIVVFNIVSGLLCTGVRGA